MDKTAMKNFSIWARKKLIADIKYKAGLLGITEEGMKEALVQSTEEMEFYDIGMREPYRITGDEIKQRRQLVDAIQGKAQSLEYRESYQNVIEEVAYTWFNRLIAIRFMEVNDYLPTHVRVLSSESGTKLEPDLVTTPFDAELKFTEEEKQDILRKKNDNDVDGLFQFLFIRQCNALGACLPKLFESTADYTELLMNVSVTDQDGIVYHLVHDIEEKDFLIAEGGQVEILGWLYQYYNTELKDETFALLKKKEKITKERLPAATQLFTPDWIVRYMIENSVGRLWLNGHENEELKSRWNYYLEETEQETDVAEQLENIRKKYGQIRPEEIKIIDPCMGSGHILVYAFDVLMQIYESCGYSRRDAAKSIVEHNLYGLDIDDRAFQLAYFAVMMKARQYHRRILMQEVEPNLFSILETNDLRTEADVGMVLLEEEYRETLQYLLDIFADAKEYGSILEIEDRDYEGFLSVWRSLGERAAENVVLMLWYAKFREVIEGLAKQAILLSQKYHVVVTNPPYMGISNADVKLNDYVRMHYPDSRSDLFAVFMERCKKMMGEIGYQAMITQHAWMFLGSYARLRENLQTRDLVSLVHFGIKAFEEIGNDVVQT
ncbi:MAG: BREX-1 system adenine-specific DNA-methyltransferase PglX, partial [Lachnospiraceae bacterium]|nr:BREX-1 system adenine-specific DNA-methyltransferase PglX [Lachnospiraceae bacterium]